MIHLPFTPLAELLSALRCADLFAKHQIKIKSALYGCLPWVRLHGADQFVIGVCGFR